MSYPIYTVRPVRVDIWIPLVAIYASHHARLAHCGSDCDGNVQRCTFELCDRGICHGEPVSNRLPRFSIEHHTDDRIHLLDSCHLGNIIEYDTVTNMSWSVDARTHAIAQVVDKILAQPWTPAEELGREVPPFKRQDDCVVRCFLRFRSTMLNSLLSHAATGLFQMGLRRLPVMIGKP